MLTNLRMELFQALVPTLMSHCIMLPPVDDGAGVCVPVRGEVRGVLAEGVALQAAAPLLGQVHL